METNHILNDTPITVKAYGEIENLRLYGTLYSDTNITIIAVTDTQEQYADITVNLPEERMLGMLGDNEIAINHDIAQKMVSGNLSKIMDFLTDQPARPISYGFAQSVAIVLKPEILEQLNEIRNSML